MNFSASASSNTKKHPHGRLSSFLSTSRLCSFKYVVTFSKTETAKISGFTKNELTTTYNGQTIDVKNNAFTKNFFTVRHIEIVNLVVLITNRETTLLNSALSQLSKKILIFPFHTYW